jgi:hypothetical protein
VLEPFTAQLSVGFRGVTTVRELRDGRILIGDPAGGSIVLADLSTGGVTQVARWGAGPVQSEHGAHFTELRGDSTLIVDSRQALLIDGAGNAWSAPLNGPPFHGMHSSVLSADTLGFVLARAPIPPERTWAPVADSITLVLMAMASGAMDTVVRMLREPTRVEIEGNPGPGELPERLSFTYTLLGAGEEALLFRDGWLAIARLNPYRIDWRAPAGPWTNGVPLPFSETPVNAREMEAYRTRQSGVSSRPSMTRRDPLWAKTVAPFERHPLLPLPDGNLLVRRTPTADRPENRYDIVDRDGRLVSQLMLPPDSRIVGVGRHGVYVVTAREDENSEYLRRHPLPRPIVPPTG